MYFALQKSTISAIQIKWEHNMLERRAKSILKEKTARIANIM